MREHLVLTVGRIADKCDERLCRIIQISLSRNKVFGNQDHLAQCPKRRKGARLKNKGEALVDNTSSAGEFGIKI